MHSTRRKGRNGMRRRALSVAAVSRSSAELPRKELRGHGGTPETKTRRNAARRQAARQSLLGRHSHPNGELGLSARSYDPPVAVEARRGGSL